MSQRGGPRHSLRPTACIQTQVPLGADSRRKTKRTPASVAWLASIHANTGRDADVEGYESRASTHQWLHWPHAACYEIVASFHRIFARALDYVLCSTWCDRFQQIWMLTIRTPWVFHLSNQIQISHITTLHQLLRILPTWWLHKILWRVRWYTPLTRRILEREWSLHWFLWSCLIIIH
jgi:hypothetical protein